MTTYQIINYNGEDIASITLIETEDDDWDMHPFDGPVVLGSNECVRKYE